MQMYIIIFLNFVTFHMLKYMEFNLVTEKINLVSLFNIILIYFFAIYNKKVFKSIFYIHPASLFVLITLIVYNSLVLNKLLLTLSIFLFVLFFVLDYKYNAINLKSNKKNDEYNKGNKTNWEDIQSAYEQKQEREQERRKNQEKAFENDLNNLINLELEGNLVLLELSPGYTLKELKKAYKIQAHKNHPDKFTEKEKDTQTIIMQEINRAKNYLEDILSKDI